MSSFDFTFCWGTVLLKPAKHLVRCFAHLQSVDQTIDTALRNHKDQLAYFLRNIPQVDTQGRTRLQAIASRNWRKTHSTAKHKIFSTRRARSITCTAREGGSTARIPQGRTRLQAIVSRNWRKTTDFRRVQRRPNATKKVLFCVLPEIEPSCIQQGPKRPYLGNCISRKLNI